MKRILGFPCPKSYWAMSWRPQERLAEPSAVIRTVIRYRPVRIRIFAGQWNHKHWDGMVQIRMALGARLRSGVRRAITNETHGFRMRISTFLSRLTSKKCEPRGIGAEPLSEKISNRLWQGRT